MADAESLLDAMFDLSSAIHECRNKGSFLSGEKTQLRLVFDRLTTRATLIRLSRDDVDARPEEGRKAALDQLVLARDLLREADRKSERQAAIGEAFETLALLEALLPEQAQPFLI
jgi:hypothetical protein